MRLAPQLLTTPTGADCSWCFLRSTYPVLRQKNAPLYAFVCASFCTMTWKKGGRIEIETVSTLVYSSDWPSPGHFAGCCLLLFACFLCLSEIKLQSGEGIGFYSRTFFFVRRENAVLCCHRSGDAAGMRELAWTCHHRWDVLLDTVHFPQKHVAVVLAKRRLCDLSLL